MSETELAVIWRFTGPGSTEKVLAFMERWLAGEVGVDVHQMHPTLIRSVDVNTDAYAHAASKRKGPTLRSRREALGLTQAEVAELADLNTATVSRCENGQLTHLSRSWSQLADALDKAEARR